MSQSVTVRGKTYAIASVNDMIRAIVDQTQPTTLQELVVGLGACIGLAPSSVQDHLNDLVQQGAVKLDDSGRFTI